MTNPLLMKAARLIEQARAVRDRYADDAAPPADAARQISSLLREAKTLRTQAERDHELAELDSWISEPIYKHDMSNGATAAEAKGWTPAGDSREPDGLPRSTKSFLDWVRTGHVAPEQKADLVENATGQNLIPTDYAGTIVKAIAREGVFRRIALVRPTTRDRVDVGSVAVGTPAWGKLETGSTPPDGLAATPAAKDTIAVHDLTALAKIGRDELEDSDENLAAVVRDALAFEFAKVEDDAFANGSGTGQPWAVHHNVTQNVTAAAAGVVVPDDLKKLPFRVAARFRRNGVYVAHTQVEEAVALLKDADGRYMLQPNSAAGEPPTLFGYPFYSCDGLPDLAQAGADDPSAMFGDFRSGYMIADRSAGIRVQRLDELYAAEGKIGLLITLRVGGDVIRPLALAKLLV